MTPQPFARNHLLRDASLQAVYNVMAADKSVHIFGEGAHVKAHYDAPQIEKAFGDRVHTMPISEDGNMNFAVGASLLGITPIVDVISADFLYRAMDSICNTAVKAAYVAARPSTIVVRSEFLVGGPTTGQRPEALFTHIPGLRVVCPSTPREAYGLMLEALRTPGITLYFEDRMVADDDEWIEADLRYADWAPLGSLARRAVGRGMAATVLTYGIMRQRVERALRRYRAQLPDDGDIPAQLPVSLYDLATLYPVDFDYLADVLLARSKRLLVIEPDVTYGGIGAEIVAQVAQRRPEVRVKRLGAPRATIPACAALHDRMLPSDEEIIDAIAHWD